MNYRTRPIRVEAWQWDPKATDSVPYWVQGALDLTDNHLHGKMKRVGKRLQVVTADGTAMADPGDFIVFFVGTTLELKVHSSEDFSRLYEEDERRARIRSTERRRPGDRY